jgi:Tol biopolymer transport system component
VGAAIIGGFQFFVNHFMSRTIQSGPANAIAMFQRLLSGATIGNIILSYDRPMKLKIAFASITLIVLLAATAYGQASHVTLLEGTELTNSERQVIAISRQGDRFIYVSQGNFYIQGIGEDKPLHVPGLLDGFRKANPEFSPDGHSVAYWSMDGSELRRFTISGGPVTTICKADAPFGLSWAPDRTIVYGQGSKGIWRVPTRGGAPENIVKAGRGEILHGPQVLPGAETVLFTVGDEGTPASSRWDRARIVVQSLKSGERKTIVAAGHDGRYLPSGYLVYALNGNIMAVRFDLTKLETVGSPARVVDDVMMANGGATGAVQFSVSDNGVLAYISKRFDPNVVPNQIAMVAFDGTRKMLGPLPAGTWAPRISPDGQHVTFMAGGDVYGTDISNIAAARRIIPRANFPVYSPDGQWIAFESQRDGGEGLYVQRADGSGQAELVEKPGRAPEQWPAGDQGFSFISFRGDGADYDLWTYSVKEKAVMPLVVVPKSGEISSQFSPDGHWFAYMSSESGDWQVYVQPYPTTGARYQVTTKGGRFPVWSNDSREIIFEYDGKLFSTTVDATAGMAFGKPVELPITGFTQTLIRRNYDLAPDGKHFLMVFRSPTVQVDFISNWFEELNRRLKAE